jgi:hypothetical protein
MSEKNNIAVLYARSDSCYFDLAQQVFDITRDARTYDGDLPVIAHPPCRSWGRLRHLAKPRPDEKALALHALAQVRRCGGVLEHPMGSSLWKEAQLPPPGCLLDDFGGYTILIDQGWFGHSAPKPTYLYIVGVSRSDLPSYEVQLHRAVGRTLDLSPAEREKTPLSFAKWLVTVASSVQLHLPAASVTLSQVNPAAKRAHFKQWMAMQ